MFIPLTVAKFSIFLGKVTAACPCFHTGDFESDDYYHTISLNVGSNKGLHTMETYDSSRGHLQ
jgi:hypothetical protein